MSHSNIAGRAKPKRLIFFSALFFLCSLTRGESGGVASDSGAGSVNQGTGLTARRPQGQFPPKDGGGASSPSSKPEPTKPPVTSAPPVPSALQKSGSVGAAANTLNQSGDHLNLQNRQAFQDSVNNAAIGHAQLLKDADSGKYDNKDLPKLLTLMGLMATSPTPPPPPASGGSGGSGKAAATPAPEAPTTTSPGISAATPPPEASVTPDEAVNILLGTGASPAPDTKTDQLVTPQVMAQTSAAPGASVVLVAPIDEQLDPAASNSKLSPENSAALTFDDKARNQNPNAKTSGAGSNQNLVQQVFGSPDDKKNAGSVGPLTEAFLRAKARELIQKQLAKLKAKEAAGGKASTPQELREKELLQTVQSDPAAYNRLVDSLAGNLAQRWQADPAAVEALLGPVPTDADPAAGNGGRGKRGLASKTDEKSAFPVTLVMLGTLVTAAGYFTLFRGRKKTSVPRPRTHVAPPPPRKSKKKA